jgi:hypothetical protein
VYLKLKGSGKRQVNVCSGDQSFLDVRKTTHESAIVTLMDMCLSVGVVFAKYVQWIARGVVPMMVFRASCLPHQ